MQHPVMVEKADGCEKSELTLAKELLQFIKIGRGGKAEVFIGCSRDPMRTLVIRPAIPRRPLHTETLEKNPAVTILSTDQCAGIDAFRLKYRGKHFLLLKRRLQKGIGYERLGKRTRSIP